jgi:hypothetical protein
MKLKIYLSLRDWYPKVSEGRVFWYIVPLPFIVIRWRRVGWVRVKPNKTYRIEGWYEY